MADIFIEVRTRIDRERERWVGGRDDDQGTADWRAKRQECEAHLLAAEGWGTPFDEASWRVGTRQALLELAALAIAQVESLDRVYR